MADRLARLLASDRAVRLMGYLTLCLVALMFFLAGMTIPRIASNTEASRRTDDLASCRAVFNAAVEDANIVLLRSFGDVQTGISESIVASIRQDPTTLALVAADLAAAEDRKAEAFALLTEATDAYSVAVDLSREDPERFLEECG